MSKKLESIIIDGVEYVIGWGNENRLYTLKKWVVPCLDEKLEELNKKARKTNSEPVSYKVVNTYEVEDNETKEITTYKQIIVFGSSPKFSGWQFVATIQPSENGNIVRVVPSMELPTMFRTTDTFCQHCNSKRYRKEVFVVVNEHNQYKQVGRSCLKDFLGHKNPNSIISYLEDFSNFFESLEAMEKDETDEYYKGGQYTVEYAILPFLAYTSAMIRKYGWTSGSKAKENEEISTASMVWGDYNETKEKYRWLKDHEQPTEADNKLAEDSLNWVLSLEGELNDYLYNINLMAKNGKVESKNKGYIASIIASYQKELAKAEEKKAEAEKKAESKHMGTIGKRADFILTVLNVYFQDHMYGTTKIHHMQDENGNRFVWFASSECLDIGTEYKLKGTVKEHNDYKGTKQTILTRCKVM